MKFRQTIFFFHHFIFKELYKFLQNFHNYSRYVGYFIYWKNLALNSINKHFISQMYRKLIFTLLFVLATSQEYITFSYDENALSKCIDDYFLTHKDPYYRETGISKMIAKRLASRNAGKTEKKKSCTDSVNNLYYDLKVKKSFLFPNNVVYEALQSTMKYALLHCAINTTQPSQLLQLVPNFANEMKFWTISWLTGQQDHCMTLLAPTTVEQCSESTLKRLE